MTIVARRPSQQLIDIVGTLRGMRTAEQYSTTVAAG